MENLPKEKDKGKYIALLISDIKQSKEFFRQNPNGKIRVNWNTTLNKREFENWLMDCIHSKINRNKKSVGKRDSDFYYWNAKRLQRQVNSNCVIRDFDLNFDKRLFAKLSHLILVDY